jgi:two-component system, LytTR family, response regulator AlgR
VDILVVDDESLARQRLCRILQELGHEVVAEAQNADEALAAVNTYDPTVVLLDIEMPEKTGLEVGRQISTFDNPPAIIFCTAYDHYALDAFDTLAVGYLLKPVKRDQLATVLAKAQILTKAQLAGASVNTDDLSRPARRHIAAKNHRGVELIALNTVRCFMADQKYVTVIHANGKMLIDETLKELESELVGSFIRVHRNSLVSIAHIQGMTRDAGSHYSVRLEGVEEKPLVSRRYAGKLREVLKNL